MREKLEAKDYELQKLREMLSQKQEVPEENDESADDKTADYETVLVKSEE